MKIPDFKVNVEKSENFSEEKFGIGNIGFILNILRDKLYSNIIESACREYASNARDAHREIGTPDRPIEIHFPNAFESNYRIRDYGIGISKSRMTEVFLQYGNSTKRNDNIQIGGFGIGAKIFFGYSQQFSIVTICNGILNNKSVNTKYTYIAFVDSSQEGRLNLVKEEVTDEPTGTEIICAVQDKDIQAFIDGTLKSTHYWPTRPLLFGKNPIPEYVDTVGNLLASGENWKIYNTKSSHNSYSRTKAESLAIIDGIQYKINENFINENDRWILSCNVHLFFGIGELTLSASRESLQYDENTKKLINQRIKAVQKELSEQIVNIIDQKSSYLEAVQFYSFMSTYFYKVVNSKTFTWHGFKIIGPDVGISLDILNKIKANIAGYGKYKHYGKTSVKLHHDNKIVIDKNTQYYFNDIDPTHTYRNKNLKALESNSYIQIINYIKGKTYDDFVADIKAKSLEYFSDPLNGGLKNYRGDTDNSFIFDVIKPIPLSSVIEDKVIPIPRVIKPKISSKFEVYVFSASSGWKLRDYFYPKSVESDIEGCYIETIFKDNVFKTKHKNEYMNFTISELSDLKKFVGDIQIYSVKEKDIPKFTNLKPLSEILEKKFKELVTNDYYNSMAMNQILSDYNGKHYNTFSQLDKLKKIVPYKNKISDKKSLVLKYFDYFKHSDNTVSLNFVNRLEELLNHTKNINLPVKNAKLLLDEMKNRYKLLDSIYSNARPDHVIDYINACDRNLIHK